MLGCGSPLDEACDPTPNPAERPCRQQRSRGSATASGTDLPGRSPYESGRKIGLRSGSSICVTTICAMRSATVGTPRIRFALLTYEMPSASRSSSAGMAVNSLDLPATASRPSTWPPLVVKAETRCCGALSWPRSSRRREVLPPMVHQCRLIGPIGTRPTRETGRKQRQIDPANHDRSRRPVAARWR